MCVHLLCVFVCYCGCDTVRTCLACACVSVCVFAHRQTVGLERPTPRLFAWVRPVSSVVCCSLQYNIRVYHWLRALSIFDALLYCYTGGQGVRDLLSPCVVPAMPCNAMLCHAMRCNAMLCYAMPCNAMPCHAMPLLYHAMHNSAPLISRYGYRQLLRCWPQATVHQSVE